MTKLCSVAKCAVPENIHTPPQKGLEFPGGGGGGGSVRPKNLKKCMEFPLGWMRGLTIPSVGEVWIFSGITQ